MFVIEGTEYEACPTFSQIGRPLQAMPLEYWEWSERHSYTPEAEQYTLLLSAEKNTEVIRQDGVCVPRCHVPQRHRKLSVGRKGIMEPGVFFLNARR